MQKTSFKKIGHNGFTLIELLVVLAIIGILSGFVYTMMSGGINAAKDAKRKADVDTIQKALLAMQIAGKPLPLTACTFGGGATPCSTIFTGNSDLTPYLPTTPIDPTPGSGYIYTPIDANGNFEVTAILSTTYAYGYNTADNEWFYEAPVAGVCASVSDSFCAPTSGLCATGSPTSVSGSGPWTWTCGGLYGGASSPQCSANKTTSVAYTAPGTYTWTVPSCLSSINVEVIGAGGGAGAGGGGDSYNGGSVSNGGYGGSAGTRTVSNGLSVTPGNSITIVIGNGGAGGGGTPNNGLPGSTGGASSFGGTIVVGAGGNGGAGGYGWYNGGSCCCSGCVGALPTVGADGYGTGVTGERGDDAHIGWPQTYGLPGANGGNGYGSGGGGGGAGRCCFNNGGTGNGGDGGNGAQGRVTITVP